MFSSPDAALKAAREDLGDCTRCKLHTLGRKQIVFGVGNPNADLIVANDVSAPGTGFDVTTNAVTIIGAEGEQTLPLQSKARIAEAILDRVEALIRSRASTPARA